MAEQFLQLGGNERQVGFTMDLDPNTLPDAFLLEHFSQGKCYEAEQAWVMFRTLYEGDIAIDVGANIGFFTLLMAKLVGARGKIIACEPGANNLPFLKAHLRKNEATNVIVEERPIWCRDEVVTFFLNADCRSSNALYDPGNFPTNEKSRAHPNPVEMEAVTIDSLIDDADAPFVKLIKIDTEGAEQKVLEGASTLLEMHHPPYILAELNPHGLYQAGNDAESLRDLMRGFGYEMFFIHSDDKIPSLVPRNTRVKYVNGLVVSNVLFSTLEDIGKAWPESIGNG